MKTLSIFCCLFVALFLAACGNSSPQQTPNEEVIPSPTSSLTNSPEDTNLDHGSSTGYPADTSGYPADTSGYPADTSGYPAQNSYEDLSNTPPDPDIALPETTDDMGAIGGVLIREVVGEGFEPLVPRTLMLASIVLNTEGIPAFISAGDESQKAELFPTGIFIFNNVPPGTYGFMVDVGYTEFFIKDNEGNPMLVEVEAGEVLDLGQIITELPNS